MVKESLLYLLRKKMVRTVFCKITKRLSLGSLVAIILGVDDSARFSEQIEVALNEVFRRLDNNMDGLLCRDV